MTVMVPWPGARTSPSRTLGARGLCMPVEPHHATPKASSSIWLDDRRAAVLDMQEVAWLIDDADVSHDSRLGQKHRVHGALGQHGTPLRQLAGNELLQLGRILCADVA